jgi:hypothetical protein
MPHIIDHDADRAKRRRKIASCLTEIVAETAAALREAGLPMQVFFSVPSSGDALATFATPGDPCEEDWLRSCSIITAIVEGKLGVEGLWTKALPCVASGVHMGAADIIIIPASPDHRPESEPSW